MSRLLDPEITDQTKVTLPMAALFSVVTAIVFASAGYGGQRAALSSLPDREQVRSLAREEIKAANVADGTTVAVLFEKVTGVEKAITGLVDEQKKTNDLLRRLVRP